MLSLSFGQVSNYFPQASYDQKPLYYSYETCGSFDSFTLDSRSACVNQETEAKCLALGSDPDDPEERKCAWGGGEPLGFSYDFNIVSIYISIYFNRYFNTFR